MICMISCGGQQNNVPDKELVNLQNGLGVTILKSRGIHTAGYWYWVGIGALIGYTILFNILVTFALGYFNRKLST